MEYLQNPAHSKEFFNLIMPIVPSGNVVTGVGSWVNTLVETAQGIMVHPLAMNVTGACQLKSAIELSWDDSHRTGAVVGALEDSAVNVPDNSTIFLFPCWGEIAYLAAVQFASRRANTYLIGVCHTDDESYYSILKNYLPSVSALVAVSDEIEGQLHRRFPDRAIFRMHYPIMPRSITRHIKTDSEPIRILYAGRLVERQKRVSRLISLAKELDRLSVPCVINIAGEGPEQDKLKNALAAQSSVTLSVRMHGLVPPERMNELYAANDVYVMTSDYEGSPLSLLEAMASGLAPVVMDIRSGVQEVVSDGETGFNVSAGDTSAMAQRIRQLAEGRDLLMKMGKKAAALIAESQSPKRCWSQIHGAMEAATSHHRPEGWQPVDLFAAPIERLLASVRAGGGQRFAVYGAGMFGRNVVDALIDAAIEVSIIVDGDPATHGRVYRGIRIEAVTTLSEATDCGGIIIGSLASQSDMAKLAGDIRADLPIFTPLSGAT